MSELGKGKEGKKGKGKGKTISIKKERVEKARGEKKYPKERMAKIMQILFQNEK